ncbi:MAG TPA: hypothetical protein DD670_19605 [Planctomycetaceae bacterium]|nr:hypothetical protein [Planctomycetaceae bacterium]
MARRLALELTSVEARALLLTVSETRVHVEKSLTLPLAAETEGADQPAVERRVVDFLTQNGISRVETLAVVGRADIELRLLSVPPSPDNELPNLVRFQAAGEFANLDADALLDYLPLDEPVAGQPRRVLAAVLKPGVKQRLEKICHDAKLTLNHIVLRSAASASLLLRQKPELRDACCLLVEILGRHVELAAVRHGRIVFLRHMLLSDNPEDVSDAAESLSSEIRRTRVVVANQENVETVEPIVFVRDDQRREALAQRLGDELGAPVLLIDPVPESPAAAGAVPFATANRDRFAALLGAVADDAAGRPPALDFMHPRQPPKAASRRNTYAAGALAAIVVVFGVMGLNWLQTSSLRKEIQQHQERLRDLERQVKEADEVIEASETVAGWFGNETVWIDELRWLSEQFPPAKDGRLTSLIAVSNERLRRMSLKGNVRREAVTELDRGLRDDRHRVAVERKTEVGTDAKYPIQFSSSVQILSP